MYVTPLTAVPPNSITSMQVRFPSADLKVPPVRIPNIDLSKKYIVLWVPGTNSHSIPEEFLRDIKQHFGDDATTALVDYEAAWTFRTSMAHGYATLRATLEYLISNMRPGTKILLAGLSQGSMVISELLTNPRYYQLISRAALLGHPGVAANHVHGVPDPKISEFNNPFDPSTLPWRGDPVKIIKSVDSFMRGDILDAVYLLKVAALNPLYTTTLAALGLKNTPFYTLASRIPVPKDIHDYRESMDDAAYWLYMGK